MRTSLIAISLLIGSSALADNTNWMSELPDDTPVRTLSIPGAHDAATSSVSNNVSKCQSKNIANLFDAGVRAFDLRPAYSSSADGKLMIYHGSGLFATNTGVTLKSALSTLIDKIKNTSEFVIVLMRNESADNDAERNADWENAMNSLFSEYSENIATWQKGMTVGDARGKVIAMCRNYFDSDKVAMITNWNHSDMNQDAILTLGENKSRLYVQDRYDNPGADTKHTIFNNLLNVASSNTGKREIQTWIINHTSYVPGTLGQPRNAANTTNPVALNYVSNGTGSTGIILMDFAADSSYKGDQLVNAIIARNTFVKK